MKEYGIAPNVIQNKHNMKGREGKKEDGRKGRSDRDETKQNLLFFFTCNPPTHFYYLLGFPSSIHPSIPSLTRIPSNIPKLVVPSYLVKQCHRDGKLHSGINNFWFLVLSNPPRHCIGGPVLKSTLFPYCLQLC